MICQLEKKSVLVKLLNRQRQFLSNFGIFAFVALLSMIISEDALTKIEADYLTANVKDAVIEAHGGWNGSGGGGIVCFKNDVLVSKAMDKNGKIKENYLSRVKQVTVLELADLRTNGISIEPSVDAKGQETFALENVLNENNIKEKLSNFKSADDVITNLIESTVAPSLPILASLMTAAHKQLKTSLWEASDWLPNLQDHGKSKRPNQNCKFVQIAMRTSYRANPNYLPRAKVIVYGSLLKQMKKIMSPSEYLVNTSTLLLHEIIYYLGFNDHSQENNSILTQELTKFFLVSYLSRNQGGSSPQIVNLFSTQSIAAWIKILNLRKGAIETLIQNPKTPVTRGNSNPATDHDDLQLRKSLFNLVWSYWKLFGFAKKSKKEILSDAFALQTLERKILFPTLTAKDHTEICDYVSKMISGSDGFSLLLEGAKKSGPPNLVRLFSQNLQNTAIFCKEIKR